MPSNLGFEEAVERARTAWSRYDSVMDVHAPCKEYMKAVKSNQIPRYNLNGKDYKIQIPDKLLTELRPKLVKEGIVPYRDGKLDLVSILRLWKVVNEKLYGDVSCLNEKGWFLSVMIISDLLDLDVGDSLQGHKENLASIRHLKREMIERLETSKQQTLALKQNSHSYTPKPISRRLSMSFLDEDFSFSLNRMFNHLF